MTNSNLQYYIEDSEGNLFKDSEDYLLVYPTKDAAKDVLKYLESTLGISFTLKCKPWYTSVSTREYMVY